MRRHKKEIIDKSVIIDLLGRATVGRLGTIGQDGYPRIKPLNFVYVNDRIYFHSAREGQDDPCKASYLYQSVIIYGKAALVGAEPECRKALSELMRKYQPGGGYGEFPEAKLALTAVVRIDIETMTGKEDLGKGALRERVVAGLQTGTPLPIEVQGEDG
jgi:hypothetical protein